jgi:hypothetical protein
LPRHLGWFAMRAAHPLRPALTAHFLVALGVVEQWSIGACPQRCDGQILPDVPTLRERIANRPKRIQRL